MNKSQSSKKNLNMIYHWHENIIMCYYPIIQKQCLKTPHLKYISAKKKKNLILKVVISKKVLIQIKSRHIKNEINLNQIQVLCKKVVLNKS